MKGVTKMKPLLSDEVIRLQNVIARKRGGLNVQAIDDEILGYISVYKYGSREYRDRAKNVLIGILVNSGMVKKKRDIIANDWRQRDDQ